MTHSYVDPSGRKWEAAEAFRVGAGARGEGDAFPEATHITVRFESGDESRWASNVPDDWWKPENIVGVFDRAEK